MRMILSSRDFRSEAAARAIYSALGKPASSVRLLFIPNEKADSEKIRSGKYHLRMEEFGFNAEKTAVFNYTCSNLFTHLDIDAVYISGGNTFGTMARLKSSGFDREIVRYVRQGALYIGGSAGAHIASADMAHVQLYDSDTFGLTDFAGLGLFNGIFLCHYTPEREAHFLRLKAEGKYPVYPLTDDEYIEVFS